MGTELLLGEVLDTNSAFLAGELASLGIDVYWSLRVGDNASRLEQALEQALNRSDLVVLTGGLGPTDDDLTRETIARVLGETPQVDAGLERDLRAFFAGRSRPMPERNLKQAWLIPSAEALPNPNGTAPGWFVRSDRFGRERLVVALPGPPRELTPMWHSQVVPRLVAGGQELYRHTFRTTGIGESDVADLLAKFMDGANPSVATYAKRDGVHVRVASKAASREEARLLAAPVERRVSELLGTSVWGHDDDELADLISSRLAETGRSIAVAEGPGGGLLAATLTGAMSAEVAFRGGVLAWAAQAMGILGMPRPAEHGSAGGRLAVLMADAARETFTADFGLSTHVAVPAGGSVELAGVTEVFIALTSDSDPVVKRLELPHTDAGWRRERVMIAALHLAWSSLRPALPADNK